MKNVRIDFKCTDNHIGEMMEGGDFDVSNKQIMKERVEKTTLSAVSNFVQMEKWDGADSGMPVAYQFAASAFGEILVASTIKGVCYMGFSGNNREKTLHDLKRRFPASLMEEKETEWQNEVILQMNNPEQQLPVHLHLKGTDFQLSIWKKLLKVPLGGLTTYAQLGGHTKNARAVGTAIGSNPVGYILPCHRVIRGDGSAEGYFWGTELKKRLLTWEAAEAAFALT